MPDRKNRQDKITRDTLKRLAVRCDPITMMVLENHPIVLFELLSDVGKASVTAKNLASRELQMKVESLMLGRPYLDHPDHEAFHEAFHKALQEVSDAFEAVVEATFLCVQLLDECECPNCKRRRLAENAKMS